MHGDVFSPYKMIYMYTSLGLSELDHDVKMMSNSNRMIFITIMILPTGDSFPLLTAEYLPMTFHAANFLGIQLDS